LYRQSEIYARHGVELERSTLADWVGGTSGLLEPLVASLRRYVMAAGKLHADDTAEVGLANHSLRKPRRSIRSSQPKIAVQLRNPGLCL